MPTKPFHTITAVAAPVPSLCRKYAPLLLCGLSLALGAVTVSAEELTVDEMACALDPHCSKPFVDRRLRGVTATPSVRPPGSFDRTVNFSFNSAELTPEARKELDAVAEALTRPNTTQLEIVISGHTDAVGSPEYNQKLSERRAEAARQYLMTQHGITGDRLVAKGFGKAQLLLPTDPNSELNRRVSFQNPNYAAASASGGSAPAQPAPASATPSGRATTSGDGF
ncbi:MAG: OmpA family protein [Alphaproteobacteria bacterium]|nr:MAG: OmpA family protein [Alphaproteobacteria bacterium]